MTKAHLVPEKPLIPIGGSLLLVGGNMNSFDKKDINTDKVDLSADQNAAGARREFLKKAGKFAIYTPPVMMMLMHPGTKSFAMSAHADNGVGNGPDALPPGILNNDKTYLDNDDNGGVPGDPQNQGGFQ